MTRGSLTIRRETRAVLLDGSPLSLGARAFDVLAYLDTHRDRVVTKADLLEHVWGGLTVEEGNLTVQISALRKALGAKAIATVPGVGYKLATASAPPCPTGPALPDTPSVVVLPFANLGGGADKDYLVDGLVTDLIASLSALPGLFVIASSTSFRYRGRSVDLADVGRELGVRYAVEGSIQQGGDRLRITVQLVEAATGRTLWSGRFPGLVDEIFDLQDQVAASVAGAIEPNLLLAETGRAARKPTDDLRAYDLLLRAMPHIVRLPTVEDFHKGVALLDRAIACDPDYNQAKAWKVRSYIVARGSRMISMETLCEIAPLASALLRDHRGDALVLGFASIAVGMTGTNQKAAADAARAAAALSPNSSLVLTSAGFPLAYVGDYEAAIACFEHSIRLDPLGHHVGYCRGGIGECLAFMGRYDEALICLEQAFADHPQFKTVVQWLMHCYVQTGQMTKAEAMRDLWLEVEPGLSLSGHCAVSPFRQADQRALFATAFRAVGLPD